MEGKERLYCCARGQQIFEENYVASSSGRRRSDGTLPDNSKKEDLMEEFIFFSTSRRWRVPFRQLEWGWSRDEFLFSDFILNINSPL